MAVDSASFKYDIPVFILSRPALAAIPSPLSAVWTLNAPGELLPTPTLDPEEILAMVLSIIRSFLLITFDAAFAA